MDLDLRPRDSLLVCPPCRSAIDAGPKVRCPECGAVYHEECGLTFGRCVNLACFGRLANSDGVQALHRVGTIARRLPSWRSEGLVRRAGQEGPWIVFLLPGPRLLCEDEAAARRVGEVLGQSTYDGRLRLQARHPELLVRVESRAEVARILRDLRQVGVDAYSMSLVDFVQPLASFASVAVFNADPLLCADAAGEMRTYGADQERLVVRLHYIDTSQRRHLAPFSKVTTPRRRLTLSRSRHEQHGFFVFRPDEAVPLEVTEGGLEHLVGVTPRPTAREDVLRVRELFLRGARAQTRSLTDVDTPRLLQLVPALEGARDADTRSNRTSVRLMARLIQHAWLEARLKRAPKRPVGACA